MAIPVTAADEVMTRIRSLDREETWLKKQAQQALTLAAKKEAEAEAIAVKRRQYEFLLGELTDASPEVVHVKPKKQPNVIGILGVTV